MKTLAMSGHPIKVGGNFVHNEVPMYISYTNQVGSSVSLGFTAYVNGSAVFEQTSTTSDFTANVPKNATYDISVTNVPYQKPVMHIASATETARTYGDGYVTRNYTGSPDLSKTSYNITSYFLIGNRFTAEGLFTTGETATDDYVIPTQHAYTTAYTGDLPPTEDMSWIDQQLIRVLDMDSTATVMQSRSTRQYGASATARLHYFSVTDTHSGEETGTSIYASLYAGASVFGPWGVVPWTDTATIQNPISSDLWMQGTGYAGGPTAGCKCRWSGQYVITGLAP